MFENISKNKNVQSILLMLQFIRVRNCLMTILGVIVGASLAYDGTRLIPVTFPVLKAALAAALIAAGGNTLNDYFDLEVDKVNKPNRPLPSGRITKSDGLMFSIGLFLVGLAIAKSINRYTLVFAVINTVLLIIYARYSKKLFVLSNFMISYLVASIFIYGMLSVQDPTAALNPGELRLTWILVACSFFITFSREVIKDIEDFEGDKRMYSRTLPIVFGNKRARIIASVFAIAAIALSLSPILSQSQKIVVLAYAPLMLLADLLFVLALTMYAPLAQLTMAAGMNLALAAFFLANILTRV